MRVKVTRRQGVPREEHDHETVRSGYDGSSGIVTPRESTEMGDVLENLNLDKIEDNTRMSGIDLRARLHPIEISSVLAVDSLVALRILPIECLSFSRQKKRLSVSTDGKGRQEIVDIVRSRSGDDVSSGKSVWQSMNPFSKKE